MAEARSSSSSPSPIRQMLSWRGLLAGIVVYLVLRGTVLRPSLEEQIEQCFANVATGFAERDPGDILAQVSIDYPFTERWPQFDDALHVRPDPEGDIRYQRRQRVRAVMGQMFFILKGESPQFSFEVLEIVDDPAAPKARVRIEHISGSLPKDVRLQRPVEAVFTMQRQGWLFPTVVIRDHGTW